jgi:hypothetical protein
MVQEENHRGLPRKVGKVRMSFKDFVVGNLHAVILCEANYCGNSVTTHGQY